MKMRRSSLPLLMLFLLVGYHRAAASHLMGAHITYRNLSPKVYEITLKMYRDCRGIPMNMPATFGIRCTTGGTTYALSPVKVAITDITARCSTSAAPCTPANTTVGNEGVEMHTYLDTVDFGQGKLDTMLQGGCCVFAIFYDECCRNGAINTGSPGNYYVETLIDLCKAPGNNSPVVKNDVAHYLCCNTAYYFNLAAYDPDNDSLSYMMVPAMESPGTNFSYGGGYTYTRPLTPYFPAGWSNPNNSNPNANPPIGFFLDPVRGDMVFTPTGCNEVGPISIQVNEWRKDSAGTYRKIGEMRRDVQVIVKSCSGNNPPTLQQNLAVSYTACEGTQLCFDIISKDQRFILPPPNPVPPGDSIRLTLSRLLPGATFTKLIDTPGLNTSRFCWTPQASDVNPVPHFFTVIADDQHCPKPANTSKAFSILVKPSKRALIQTNVLSCGRLRVNMIPVDSGITNPRWEIKDSTGKLVSTDMANKPVIILKQTDTIQFRRGGKYIISLTGLTSSNCILAKNDTVVMSGILEVDAGKDTASCYGNTFTVTAGVNYNAPPYRYQWSPAGAADTLSSFTFTAVKDTVLKITVTAADGCVNFDEIRVKQKRPVNLRGDTTFCEPGSVFLDAGPGFASYSWSTGAGTRFITASGTAKYKVTVTDSNGCVSSDSLNVKVNPKPNIYLGKDTTICKGTVLQLDAGAGYKKYVWNTGDTVRTINVSKTGGYRVAVTDSNGCIGRDTVVVTMDSVPHSHSGFSITHLGTMTYNFVPAQDSGYTHIWSFSDGNYSTQSNPTHQFTSTASYTICHWITNARGCKDSTCQTLQVTGITKMPAELMSLAVYPNPFHDGTLISLQLKEQAKVNIRLYDVLGREYVLTNDETVAPGQFTQAVNSDELQLPSGMLTVKVSINGADTYLKLVKIN